MVKQNRGMIAYWLLNIITLGIYSLFFWHRYIKDVNLMCEGDGKHTRGLLALILLSLITFGIYGIVWTYGIQNRIRNNAPRYGVPQLQGGAAVLLWSIFGVLLFGIGPVIALFIQFRNINYLAYGYGRATGAIAAY